MMNVIIMTNNAILSVTNADCAVSTFAILENFIKIWMMAQVLVNIMTVKRGFVAYMINAL